MLFSEFKKYAKSKRFTENNGKLLIDLDDLGVIEWDGGKKLVIDGRSFDSPPGCWHVYPVALIRPMFLSYAPIADTFTYTEPGAVIIKGTGQRIVTVVPISREI